MDLKEFLSYIDPVFFRIAGKELDIPEKDTSSIDLTPKEVFISTVVELNLDIEAVLSSFSDLALKNGLNKLDRNKFSGVAILAAQKAGIETAGNVEAEPEPVTLPAHLENSPRKEYKVISQRDHWFTSNFDSSTIENTLNALAQGGWRLVTAETVKYGLGGIGGNREELFFFLERDLP